MTSWHATVAFLSASCLMGLGIAIDVAVATLARFRDQTMTFRSWTVPITATHIGLPAFGYYGWWLLGREFSSLALPLGLLAALLIGAFLYETVCDWVGAQARISLGPVARWLFRTTGGDGGANARWIAVLAVSFDALWSGPAKAAQAQSGAWSGPQVLVSFFIAGAVVAVIAQASLMSALLLRRIRFENKVGMARSLVIAKLAEVTILGGFGVLSCWTALSTRSGGSSLAYSIGLSGLLSAAIWLLFWRRLVAEQLRELGGTGIGSLRGE